MTYYNFKLIQCSICGCNGHFLILCSTNHRGSCDLDTRPPRMKRGTMVAWIQKCPECGYCATYVGESRPGAKAVVKSEEYREQLNNCIYPELANSFLCKAIIDKKLKDYTGAVWALIHAAWQCDDFDLPNLAATCRQKAANMLVLAEEHGQKVAVQDGLSTAIIVDLYRRSGKMDQARSIIATQKVMVIDNNIARILDFQTTLIENNDTSCHTIAEAIEKL